MNDVIEMLHRAESLACMSGRAFALISINGRLRVRPLFQCRELNVLEIVRPPELKLR